MNIAIKGGIAAVLVGTGSYSKIVAKINRDTHWLLGNEVEKLGLSLCLCHLAVV